MEANEKTSTGHTPQTWASNAFHTKLHQLQLILSILTQRTNQQKRDIAGVGRLDASYTPEVDREFLKGYSWKDKACFRQQLM